MSRGSESTPSLESWSNAWLENVRQQGRSPRTVATYGAALLNLRRHLSTGVLVDVRRVVPAQLTRWQQGLAASGCVPATLDQFTRIVRSWFRWLHQRGILFENPADGLRGPQVPRTFARCPTEEQMRRVLRAAGGRSARALRDVALLELAYASGARLSELATLKLASLNLPQRVVLLEGKGRRQRVVPLTRKAVGALRRYLRRARPRLVNEPPAVDALFVSCLRSRPLLAPGIAHLVRRAGAKAGVRLTPHDLRRACATHLVRGGANPAVVRELLGHASYRHLARYLRLRLELPACAAYRRRFR